jgi:anthranilate synthase component 1
VVTDGQVVESAPATRWTFIAAYQKRFKVALRPGLPRFCGGLAGYFGYDAVRYIEKKLETTCPPDTLGMPDILLLQCEELAVIDNLSGKLYLIVYADPAQPEAYARGQKAPARVQGPAQILGERPGGQSPPKATPPSAALPRPTTWRPWSAPRS